MQELRKARIQQGWSVSRLAQALGISASRLSDYEEGRRAPDRQRLGRWLEVLQLRRDQVALPEDFVHHYPDEFQLQIDQEQSWATVVHAYHREYQELDPYLQVPAWFRAAVRVDSALEALAWTQLAAPPASFRAVSPVRAGFRLHPLATGSRAPLGAAAKACFHVKHGGTTLLVWPQITIQIGSEFVRVDALLSARTTRRAHWQVLEIDGDQHFTRSERDRRRELRLKLPHIRVSQDTIRSLRFKSELLQKLSLPTTEAAEL